jgi:hypothetical protein
MGVLSCGAMVLGGGRTIFDQMQGVIDDAIQELEAAEISLEFHPGDGPLPEHAEKVGSAPREYMEQLLGKGADEEGVEGHVEPHIVDRRADALARLRECKEMVEAVWYAVLEASELA